MEYTTIAFFQCKFRFVFRSEEKTHSQIKDCFYIRQVTTSAFEYESENRYLQSDKMSSIFQHYAKTQHMPTTDNFKIIDYAKITL